MKDKVLETGIYCARCNCIIKNTELAQWECGQCDPNLNNWKHIEIVMKGKGKWNENDRDSSK